MKDKMCLHSIFSWMVIYSQTTQSIKFIKYLFSFIRLDRLSNNLLKFVHDANQKLNSIR